MKVIIKLTLAICLLTHCTLVQGQQQPNYSQNKQAQMFFNPGNVATEEGVTARLLGRWQWVGFEGAPTTYSAGLEYGLPQHNLGLGLGVISDESAEFRNTSAQLFASYKLKTSSTAHLSMGLSGAINHISQKLTETYVLQQENLFSSNLSETNANFGVGFHFQERNWWAGVSVPFLLNQSFEDNSISFFDQRRHYYLQGGYRFSVSPKVDLEPTALAKLVSGAVPDLNLTMLAWYDEKIGGGIGWRNQESVNFIIQTNITDGILLGYAVDMIIDKDLSQLSNSSHEVVMVFKSANVFKSKDSDNDGVKDKIDECPNLFGPTHNGGCPYPDTDDDGIFDAQDSCPLVAGIAELGGCPDTDGDGITDAEDRCPNQKGILKNQGCADTDGDGVVDDKDVCPILAGLPQFDGCPDTDSDGVPDKFDNCPNEAGTVTNGGCPEVSEEVNSILAKAVDEVKFESGKDVLTPQSLEILDQLAQMLKSNEHYNLQISGYTDSSGDDEKNLELSKQRAHSVLEYLVSKGIDSSRISADGFGEANPIADNTTSVGRAKNRRVEFNIDF